MLATALAQGISPNTLMDAPACTTIDWNPVWRPCNYGGGGGGTVTIAEGTVRSYNTLYAKLMMDVGPANATEAATRYGIMSPLEPVPAAVLGSNDVTAMDMAAAFSTFTNRGIRVPPVLVTRITRADGTVLFSHEHTQTKVLEAGVADTVTSILEQVVERGTGTKAQLDRPAAGKTGTTDDHRGRVVRRLHAGAGHRRVGGVPQARARRQEGADAAADHPDPGHRRLLPR